MDTYRTEEEQVEALKKWWEENGRSTILGVVLAIGLVGGWRFWQGWQEDQSSAASEVYQSLLEADALALENDAQHKTATFLATQLREEYSRSGYAELAALFLARYAAEAGNWDEAEAQLQWLIDRKPDAALLSQARLRLAQVYLGAEQYTAALAQLQGDWASGFQPLVDELRGDILLGQGDAAAALKAYELAAQGTVPGARGGNALLQMKIQQLRQKAAAEQATESTQSDGVASE